MLNVALNISFPRYSPGIFPFSLRPYWLVFQGILLVITIVLQVVIEYPRIMNSSGANQTMRAEFNSVQMMYLKIYNISLQVIMY